MKLSPPFRRSFPAAILLTILAAGESEALTRTWIGGNVDWVDNAGNANWSPADEPDPDDSAVFNTANTVNLGSSNSILELTMFGGMKLLTNGFNLTVDGLVLLSDNSTNFTVGGATAVVLPDSVTVNNGASVIMNLGAINMIEESGDGLFTIAAGGSLRGRGTVNMNDAVAAGTVLMRNDGTISASDPSVVIGTPATGVLTINANNVNARIDLDGSGGNGVVTVSRNQTLDLDVTISDPFSGDLNLFHNSVFDAASAWSIDSATLDVVSGFSAGFPPIVPATPASTSFIRGGAFTQTGGTITNADADGKLQFDAAFAMNSGNLVNNGTLVFNANAIIAAGANLTMPTATSSITVNDGVEVNVDQTNFNPDGNGIASNILTVGSGGILDLDLGVGADTTIGSSVVLNGGELDVTTDTSTWIINRGVTTGVGTGISQINGNPVTFVGAVVFVGNGSTLTMNADSTWPAGNSASVDGLLSLWFNTILSGGAFSGTGILRHNSTSTISANTTIETTTFDWDGIGIGAMHTVNDGVTFTINSTFLDSDGDMDDPITLGGNSAGIAFNGVSEWTMTHALTANSGAVGTAFIGGSSRFILAGPSAKLDVLGNTTLSAAVTFGASSVTTVSAARTLRLNGGDPIANTLAGGTINGPGLLGANTGKSLVGFGSIAADVDFDGAADLLADNGMLTVTGSIVDARNVGSADGDGIFNVVNAWNSGSVNSISLNGGEVRGGTITLDNAFGITGIGLVSARVINNARIMTAGSGTLVVETVGNDNDWDGATDTGNLTANFGTLELRDNAGFSFNGSIIAQNGGTVFANGFSLQPMASSTVSLSNGKFRSTSSTTFLGPITVGAAGTSILEIQSPGLLNITPTSTVSLLGNLRLVTTNGLIQAGVVFSGGGSLIIPNGSLVALDPSANIDVLIDNSGTLRIGGNSIGRVDAKDFQQNSTGTLGFQIGGTGLTQFDRFVVNGAAQVSGALDLSLSGGFVPVLGQTFNILSATSGVSGSFSTVTQPPGMPAGLVFRVNYLPTLAQVEVVSSSAYDVWINGFAGLTTPAQRLKSVNPDNDALNNLGEFALDGHPANGANSGKIFGKIAPVSGVDAMTLTLAMRSGATPAAGDPPGGELVLEQTTDSVTYAIQATDNLTTFTVDVSEVTGADATAIQSGLPATNSGWGYRSFRSQGPVAGDPEEFMRVFIHD